VPSSHVDGASVSNWPKGESTFAASSVESMFSTRVQLLAERSMLTWAAGSSASKGPVLALTRAMAADLVAESIRVNAVSPGTVDTPWVERLLAAAADPEGSERRSRRGSRTGGSSRRTRSQMP
jgi:NAD(P)-dependent dehydrogenase (short-subunit alcohol dehydrogenase family)